MASESTDTGVLSCGNCCEVEGYLLNPKKLPCNHVFCEECLRGHQLDVNVVVCFKCKAVTKARVEDLQSAMEGPESFCDTCKGDGTPNMTAKVFCTQCNMKYCGQHEKAHKSLNKSHKVLAIKAYKKSAYAEELRYCDTHNTEPCTLGCNKCWLVLCPLCVSSAGNCRDGLQHSLMSLIELSPLLTASLEPIKQRAEDRFDELSTIVKQTTLDISKWDIETEEAVKGLHQTRDNQMEAILAKYAALEEEYRASRSKTKEEMTGYLEKKAGIKLSQLHEQLKNLRSDMSAKHLVDLMKEREVVVNKMTEMIGTDFPSLVLGSQKEFNKKDLLVRDIEMILKPVDDVIIGPEAQKQATAVIKPLPTSLQRIRTVTVGSGPTAVCQYKGHTYVGDNGGTIYRVDAQGNVTNDFIKLNNRITGIIAHEDRLYTLMIGEPYRVFVNDLNGKQTLKWNHADSGNNSARALAVINKELIIADRTNKTFTIYTLTGDRLRDVPCDLIHNDYLTICSSGENTIIVSNVNGTSNLYKVDLTTGSIEWRSDAVTEAVGVTSYGPDYAFVTNRYRTSSMIRIIDVRTGDILGELDTGRGGKKNVYDMCVDGDTLIIPNYSGSISYYRLQSDQQ